MQARDWVLIWGLGRATDRSEKSHVLQDFDRVHFHKKNTANNKIS